MNQLTFKQLESLALEARELLSNRPQGISTSSYLQSVIKSRVPEMTPLEAERVIKDLEEGMNTFGEIYGEVLRDAEQQDMSALLERLSTHDAYNLLINVKTLMHFRHLLNHSEETITQEQIDKYRDQYISLYKPTEQTVKELYNQIWNDIKSYNYIHEHDTVFGHDLFPDDLEAFNMEDLSLEELEHIITNNDLMLCVATLLYLHHVAGSEAYASVPSNNQILGLSVAYNIAKFDHELKLSNHSVELDNNLRRTEIIEQALAFAFFLGGVLIFVGCSVSLGIMAFLMLCDGIALGPIVIGVMAFMGLWATSAPLVEATKHYEKMMWWSCLKKFVESPQEHPLLNQNQENETETNLGDEIIEDDEIVMA